ncbi:hypothetical protein HDR58_06115 [bacterium]|nr:hypothetical protein [bacterium]
MKRLCIYLTYDGQGIVDEYIGYMLRELKTCVSQLVVVCNQTKIIKGQDILEKYADQIFYRENIGLDAGGFKDALCDYIGWDKVREYDELVLVNDSCFGPFRHMTEIFDEMAGREVDFWGLLKFGNVRREDGKEFPEHIQSFFIVIRHSLITDISFKEYWDKLPYYMTFNEVVDNHEVIFTKYFADRGFTYDVLADADVNITNNIMNNYNQYGRLAYELVSKRNFPFFKKKPVSVDNIALQTQENFRRCLNYINHNTIYDVNLIWNNMIRTMNVADIYRSFHLRYIIPSEDYGLGEYKISNGSDEVKAYTVLIALCVSCKAAIEYIADYIEWLKDKACVRIYTDDPDIYQYYKQRGYVCKEYGHVSLTDEIREFSDYDLVGIVHDADIQTDDEPNFVGKAVLYNIWENLINNPSHIDRIINKFMEEPWLGLLMPPAPNFGKYFADFGMVWNGELAKVQEFVEHMNLNCRLSYDRPPIGIADNFWIRGDILRVIQDIDERDKDILPYALTYIAQHAGFCSGIVESEDYASMNEVNLDGYLNKITAQVRKQFRKSFDSYFEFEKLILQGGIEILRSRHKKIYVYGTGWMAEQYKECLTDIEGYIVSDGQPKKEEICGVKVYYLSEINVSDDVGVVVCVDEKNQKQIIPLLLDKGINDFICI